MNLQIDDAFIERWAPKFDERGIGGVYESEYPSLVADVAREIGLPARTISRELFCKIWKWKGAMRVIRHVAIDEYDSRYAPAFRHALDAPPERKLHVLLEDADKLPGVGAPTGSTILHFMQPDLMPIIDVRTVGTLHKAGRIGTKARDLEHYEEFRMAIDRIRRECPRRSLREIDKALFAYDKIESTPTQKQSRRNACRT